MTPLDKKIQSIKASHSSRVVAAGKAANAAAMELVTDFSALFDEAVAVDAHEVLHDESELAKVTALKQPALICVVSQYGASLTINFNKYKDGKFKDFDEHARGLLMSITATLLTDKYPEYHIYNDGNTQIRIDPPPPPPRGFFEWLRSLFQPRITL